MKDYPIQRYVRDARITNIYEGTSQLQVVAAIRGVTTGQYAKHIREVYEKMEIAPEHEYLRETLKCMTGKLEAATAKVAEAGSTAVWWKWPVIPLSVTYCCRMHRNAISM